MGQLRLEGQFEFELDLAGQVGLRAMVPKAALVGVRFGAANCGG